MKNVQMPDGRVIGFPDTMSDEAIGSVLKGQSQAPHAHSPWTQFEPQIDNAWQQSVRSSSVPDQRGDVLRETLGPIAAGLAFEGAATGAAALGGKAIGRARDLYRASPPAWQEAARVVGKNALRTVAGPLHWLVDGAEVAHKIGTAMRGARVAVDEVAEQAAPKAAPVLGPKLPNKAEWQAMRESTNAALGRTSLKNATAAELNARAAMPVAHPAELAAEAPASTAPAKVVKATGRRGIKAPVSVQKAPSKVVPINPRAGKVWKPRGASTPELERRAAAMERATGRKAPEVGGEFEAEMKFQTEMKRLGIPRPEWNAIRTDMLKRLRGS